MDIDADYLGTGSRRGTKDDDKFVHTRAAFSKLSPTERDWDYLTEPQKELAGLLVVSTQRSPRATTGARLAAVPECGYELEHRMSMRRRAFARRW